MSKPSPEQDTATLDAEARNYLTRAGVPFPQNYTPAELAPIVDLIARERLYRRLLAAALNAWAEDAKFLPRAVAMQSLRNLERIRTLGDIDL